eukprot:scaffold66725_cov31-Tisochrysis_lutea.AAC.2
MRRGKDSRTGIIRLHCAVPTQGTEPPHHSVVCVSISRTCSVSEVAVVSFLRSTSLSCWRISSLRSALAPPHCPLTTCRSLESARCSTAFCWATWRNARTSTLNAEPHKKPNALPISVSNDPGLVASERSQQVNGERKLSRSILILLESGTSRAIMKSCNMKAQWERAASASVRVSVDAVERCSASQAARVSAATTCG